MRRCASGSAPGRAPTSRPTSPPPRSSIASPPSTPRCSRRGDLVADAPSRSSPGGLRVAILARSVHPLHGVGGLERLVYDLVHHLARREIRVTLITKPPT